MLLLALVGIHVGLIQCWIMLESSPSIIKSTYIHQALLLLCPEYSWIAVIGQILCSHRLSNSKARATF